jgi:hypothetical protein
MDLSETWPKVNGPMMHLTLFEIMLFLASADKLEVIDLLVN